MTYPHHADWTLIPEHMHGAMQRYLDHGILPGSFLTAVLSNDLREAAGRADHINAERLSDYVRFLYNCAPGGCWGSPQAVQEWTHNGGLTGRDRDRDAVQDDAA